MSDIEREIKRINSLLTEVHSRLDAVSEEMKARQRFPSSDPHQDGAVLKFWKQFTSETSFTGRSKSYLYVALRVEGRWYLSGETRQRAMRWDELTKFIGDGRVYKGVSWVEVYMDG